MNRKHLLKGTVMQSIARIMAGILTVSVYAIMGIIAVATLGRVTPKK